MTGQHCDLPPAARERAHLILDAVADNLGFLATHIATCRLYCDINDLAGLAYSLDAGKAYFRAALDLNIELRRLTNGVAALPPRTHIAEVPKAAERQHRPAQKSDPSTSKPRGGRRSRDKGNRVERLIVRLLQDAGLGAERVPLSGSAGGSYVGDITVPVLGLDLCLEAKARADGFRELYGWLVDRDILVLKADRRDPLVVVPIALAIKVLLAAENGKGAA